MKHAELFRFDTILNPYRGPTAVEPVVQRVRVRTPSRLSCGSLDPRGITVERGGIYTAGEIVLSIDAARFATVEAHDVPGEVVLHEDLGRPSLVRRGEALMRAALGYQCGRRIDVGAALEIPHCGLGTSNALVGSVAIAINELFGNPIAPPALARYIAQNHGEELEGNDEWLQPVQCLGGYGVAALNQGGLFVLAGETTVIGAMDISEDFQVVLGVPRDRLARDAATMMAIERQSFGGFAETGAKHADQIAYRLIHDVLPGMREGDLDPAGSLVFDYRFDMGSIQNCSFSHPRLNEIAASIRRLFEDGHATMLGLSSAGPGFYAVTREPDVCTAAFQAENMDCWRVGVHNETYRVDERWQTLVTMP